MLGNISWNFRGVALQPLEKSDDYGEEDKVFISLPCYAWWPHQFTGANKWQREVFSKPGCIDCKPLSYLTLVLPKVIGSLFCFNGISQLTREAEDLPLTKYNLSALRLQELTLSSLVYIG